MLASLRREYAHLVTSGAQLLLILFAAHFNTRTGWLVCLGIMAFISLFAWMSALRRLRVVRDTPTSRIASAAQGYVELTGRGKAMPDKPLFSKLTTLPCLWYRYKVENKTSRNEWHVEDSGESNEFFMLEDETGRCVVDPSGAEIVTQHKETWTKFDYRYTEWLLLQLDEIYTIGHFRTFGGSTIEQDSNEEVKTCLLNGSRICPNCSNASISTTTVSSTCRSGCWHDRQPNAKRQSAWWQNAQSLMSITSSSRKTDACS